MTDVDIPVLNETTVFGATGRLEDTEDVSGERVLSTADEQAVVSLPAGSALLVVQRGPSADARFSLDINRITIGRHLRSNIFLDDVTVPHKHCRFLHDNGEYLVYDIGSLNGTYVDHIRVGSHLLVTGKEVQIGRFCLTHYPAVTQ